MPRQLALVLCIALIYYLFRTDRQNNDGVSRAIWIPFIWMFFAGSRELSLWLNLRTPGEITEGQPYDRVLYILLIALAIFVLRRRQINWNELFRNNIWIWLFFVYGVISIAWADNPFLSSKRWIKGLGNVFMVAVVLTEERPYQAFGFILRRLAFIFLPLSVVFIKYYPELGRVYHYFTGAAQYTGVSTQKNGLGQICLFAGIYFSWNVLINRRHGYQLGKKLDFSVYLLLIPMLVWLLSKANSATSLMCLIIAVSIFLIGNLPAISSNPKRIVTLCITIAVLYIINEAIFDIKGSIITMLGRRPDLTTRIPMWKELLSMVKNPIIGYGYESFWLGGRRQIIYEHWGVTGQAHNGYLDMYLNLGLIGVLFVVSWFISGFRKVVQNLTINYQAAILKLCLIIVVAFYNWTEATFYGISNMWLFLFLGIMDVSMRRNPGKNHINP